MWAQVKTIYDPIFHFADHTDICFNYDQNLGSVRSYFWLITNIYSSFVSSAGKVFDYGHLYNSLWLVIVTMTTVGYGDIYPQTHFGRFFCIMACIIGMLLVSTLVLALSSRLEFTPDEARAFSRIKSLRGKSNILNHKAANVIKSALLMRKQ